MAIFEDDFEKFAKNDSFCNLNDVDINGEKFDAQKFIESVTNKLLDNENIKGLDEEHIQKIKTLSSSLISVIVSQNHIFQPSTEKEHVLMSAMLSYESIIFMFRTIVVMLSSMISKTITEKLADKITEEEYATRLLVLYQNTLNLMTAQFVEHNAIHDMMFDYHNEQQEGNRSDEEIF